MTQSTTSSKKPTHYAYQVRESSTGKGYWNKVGVAWTNRDGGLSIQLECVPLDGRIILQIPKEKEPAETASSEPIEDQAA